jgi:hypothetical protein
MTEQERAVPNDVVPPTELGRRRETVEVLSDADALRALRDAEVVTVGREAISAVVADRTE